MPRSTFAMSIAAAVAAVLVMPSTLQAHDAANPRDEGGSMTGSDMMNMKGQMNQMMDHCSQMMQGTSAKPNDLWRDGTPPAGGQTEKKQ